MSHKSAYGFFCGEIKMESVIVSIITGGLALIGVIITNISSNRSIENNLRVAQAITDTKIENLTEEVRKHNDFAMKIPTIETRVNTLEREVHELKNR